MDYQNGVDENESEEKTQEDKSRKRKDIMREMVMIESDFRKKIGEKDVIEGELRKLKKQNSQIKVETQARQDSLKKLEQDIAMMESDLRGLKRKMNLI